MSNWQVQTDLGRITDVDTFMRFCSQAIRDLQGIINGKIDFSTNILCQLVEVTFPSANTDLMVNHNLNKTGVNFVIVNKAVACDVYHGVGTDTATSLYLRSTVANNKVTLLLF